MNITISKLSVNFSGIKNTQQVPSTTSRNIDTPTLIDDKEIRKDDYMGIGDQGILAVGTSMKDVTMENGRVTKIVLADGTEVADETTVTVSMVSNDVDAASAAEIRVSEIGVESAYLTYLAEKRIIEPPK